MAKVTKTSFDKQQSETQRGSQVSGKEIVLAAGHEVKGKGLQAIAENDLLIQAGGNVDIAADTNHFRNIHKETKKTSGVFTGGGGITFGSKSEKHHLESEGWTQSDASSTLGSMKGNIQIQAGKQANVMGTDLITPCTNRIDIEGAGVKVEAGKDIINTNERHEYQQSGLTLAVSTLVTDMAQAAYQSVKRSEQAANPKLKALYGMKAAEEVAMAAQNVGKVAETLEALRSGEMQGTGTTSNPSVKISVSYGNQKQTQSSESQSISHQKSTLSTGTLNVKARDEKLTFEGVNANAKEMALSGKQGIDVKGVKDEVHQRTNNQSVGGSVGVFVGMNGNSYGFGLEGTVKASKGKSNSDSERWQNSRLQADKLITNSEEGGLSLDAANVNAKRWEADLQNLNLTSRQDTEKYESKQVSVGASGSIAYGSGGGASVNAAYNNAKVDYRQVKEQTGIQVGEEGMNAVIHKHTQLNGAIIESEAAQEKNRFKTGSLGHTDLENRSEIKTESVGISAGSGGINPMQAISSALSLLGNSHESERSLTKSAISENIQIDTKTPENLTALSRDTKQANQQVNQQDLSKIQERQEMAQVIGEISNNAISLATYNEREKINRLELEKFQAAEKLGDKRHTDEGKQILAGYDARINQIQENIDRTYGIGSPNGMAIRAVTAALQAAAQNDTNGTIVALASPYLNQQIHEMTKGDTAKDKATNLIAHALLSAIEFQVTGKDPLTGAVAGVTGEVTAEIIAQKLYEKSPKELTASEKENISTLSQLAGGLAGALTAKVNGSTKQQGGSFLTATAGAETAKRAVEHNFLSTLSQDRRDVLEKKIKEGKASEKEIMEFISYEQDDHTSDYLADKARNHPEEMTDDEWSRLGSSIQRYVSESLRNRETPDEIKRSVKEIVSGNYIKGYGYAYALDDKYRSDLPSRWSWLGVDKSENEERYSDLKYKYITHPNIINNSFDGRVAQSTKEGLEAVSIVYGGLGVLKGAQAINNVMSNSTKFTLGIAGVGSVGGQLLANGEVDSRTLAIDVVTAYALKGRGFITTVGGNAASGAFNSYVTDQSMVQGAIGSGVGAGIGYGMGKVIEVPLSKKYPDLTWSKYNPQPLNDKIPYVYGYKKNIVPNVLGSMSGEFGNRAFQSYSSKQERGK
ncbi:hemagglutinin repeat-containing protein [Rodentibacter caecimuris]|uniref:hemagglutinin repeat-containing protein n=1 Tax=Rodentibacter caecimuris TaxID=1796644 RepID=UPI0022490485|nr:hemagglutinin repeat-containing protein [Rodentibacter heylii]MCX2960509.1 hemagglutinin repeat-containing protein [Rodentibacter heylii]